MRFRLTFAYPVHAALPINYNYAIAAWIYSVLEESDPQFAEWLHSKGYSSSTGKRFRLFTFGTIEGKPFEINRHSQQIIFHTNRVFLDISFYLPSAFEHFISGIFQSQTCEIRAYGAPPLIMQVEQVTALPKPDFQETMTYRTLTPICVSRHNEGERYAQYLNPNDPEYTTRLVQNLLHKYESAHLDLPKPVLHFIDLDVLTEPYSKLITIKGGKESETKIRGYLFEFRIKMPVELHEVAYYAGFGERNSMGMGLVRVV
jgi:CRISPR-associated endoribonuclease Cas6